MVWGLGCRVQGKEPCAKGDMSVFHLGVETWIEFAFSMLGIQDLGCRMYGLGFRAQGLEYRKAAESQPLPDTQNGQAGVYDLGFTGWGWRVKTFHFAEGV